MLLLKAEYLITLICTSVVLSRVNVSPNQRDKKPRQMSVMSILFLGEIVTYLKHITDVKKQTDLPDNFL